jgi:coniferyl-aldehyde dehydrogenase
MAIMQEEIFGPVLPVVTYRDLDEAIAYVNARPRPLALYYFGREDADSRKVLARTTSGNVGINNTLMHYARTIYHSAAWDRAAWAHITASRGSGR